MSLKTFTSANNPRIKAVRDLQANARKRRRLGLFVMEGQREIAMAINAGYEIETLFCCPEIGNTFKFRARFPHLTPVWVTRAAFERMVYREKSDGVLAVARVKEHTLNDLHLSDNPLVIVVEAVEKPGNLGAILRTADAARVDAIVVCEPMTDVYNPNVVRASLGCLFSQQVAVCNSHEALEWLRAHNLKTYAAELHAPHWYHKTDLTIPCAIIVGSEADGLTPFWLERADSRIKIPMGGRVDSLNVSVTTAILAFEAMRQRGFCLHNEP
ncbi:MAG: RNA methyltransferase [Prevotellaceae bacterium]|jgi:TrmH family RNA methyltransferase|nr:RNA methyltransferase [Prevotellaceae bacterium]